MTYPTLITPPHNNSYLQLPLSDTAKSSSGSPSSIDPVTPKLEIGSSRRESTTSNHSESEEPLISCRWKECDHQAADAEELYDHLCQVHVGRKSTGNLCLTCGWEGCDVKCVKRDHITSHLRVHTPLKPHPCSVCGKTFKRPQDLKKHERIHTQEHHQIHKLSKAATANDPAFNARVSGSDRREIHHQQQQHDAHRHRSPLSQSLSPSSSSQSQVMPTSPYEGLLHPNSHHNHHLHNKSPSPDANVLAALHRKQHEELALYQQREMQVLHQLALQQQQSQVYAAQLSTESFGKGNKRGQADAFDNLWEDMKRQKVEPVYDSSMVDRLNNLMPPSLPVSYPAVPALPLPSLPNGGYSATGAYSATSTNNNNLFNPIPHDTQIYPDTSAFPLPQIHTEEDLAMFNNFMIALGREAAGTTVPDISAFPLSHAQSFDSSAFSSGASSDSPNSSDQGGLEDLFNPEELAKLGLGGMPGVPLVSPTASTSFQFGSGLYPTLDTRSRGGSEASVDPSRRAIAGLPRGSVSHSSNNNRFDFNFNHYAQPLQAPSYHDPSTDFSNFSFDSLARSKQAPSATLAPRDFHKKTYRHIANLGASVSSRSTQRRESAERTPQYDEPDEFESDEMDMPTPKIPLAALLDDGGESVVLPAIDHPDVDGGEDVKPTLPSLHSLNGIVNRRAPVKRHTEDEILRGVKRLELRDGHSAPSPSPEDRPLSRNTPPIGGVEAPRDTRRRHAAIIRAWLVAVNLQYQRNKMTAELDGDDDSDTNSDVEEYHEEEE